MHRTRMAVGIVLLFALKAPGLAAGVPQTIQAEPSEGIKLRSPSTPPPMGTPIEQLAPEGFEGGFLPPLAHELHPEWTEFAPPRREHHELLYDARRDRFIVIGQRADALWEFRTRPQELWSRLPTSGHGPEVCKASVLDAAANRVIVLGTDAGGQYGLWELRLVGRAIWKPLRDAPQLNVYLEPAMVLDPAANRLLVVQEDDIWAVPLGSDAPGGQIATIPFVERTNSGPSAVFDAMRNHLLLVDYDGRLYRLDVSSAPVWLETTESLWWSYGRETTRLLLDADNDEALVMGASGNIIAISLSTSTTRTLAERHSMPLGPRWRHAVAMDPLSGEILIHGGQIDCHLVVSDMHAWNVASNSWRTVGPSVGERRWGHTVIDPLRDRLLLYAQRDRHGNPISEFKVFDLANPDAGMADKSATSASATGWTAGWIGSLLFDIKRDCAFTLGTETASGSVSLYRTSTQGGPDWRRHELSGDGPSPAVVVFHDEPGDRLIVTRHDFALFPPVTELWSLSLEALTWQRLEYSGPMVPFALGKTFYDAKRKCAWFSWRGDSLYQVRLDANRVDVTAFAIENGITWFPFSAQMYDEKRALLLGFSTPYARFSDHYLHGDLIGLEVGPRPRWVRYATNGPNPGYRGEYAFALDRKRDRLIIHGGYDDDCDYFTETYALAMKGFGGGAQHRAAVGQERVMNSVELSNTGLELHASRLSGGTAGPLDIRFLLPAAGPARLDFVDLQGRRVISRDVMAPAGSEGRLTLGEAASLRPGVYFIQLRQGAAQITRRIAVVR